MFFPQAMTEMELIVPEKDLLAVTRVLAGQGIFHQVDVSNLSSDNKDASAVSWKERAATFATLERQIMLNMQALSMEEGQPPTDGGTAMIELDQVRSLVEQIDKDVKEASSKLTANQKTLEQLQNFIRDLEPITDVDVDVSTLRNPHYIHSILGIMPLEHLERLQTSLARIPSVLLTLREDRKNAVVWLAGSQANADILDRAARSAYLNPLELSEELQGTPSEIIKSINGNIERINEEIEKQKAKLSELRGKYDGQLISTLWKVRASRMLADSMGRYGRLRYTYLIVGWIPSSRLSTVTEQLKRVSSNILIDATPSRRGGTQNQTVPVALRNPGWLGAFQSLVTTYAQPRYEEIDPTILITLTFPLLFGAMFGDVAHGLLLALFGAIIMSGRVKMLRSLASLAPLIVVCGLAATVFGFIYGSIFGLEDILPNIPFARQFVLIQPMQSRIQILEIAIGAGVILLSVGFLLNLFNAARARDWARLFFDPNGLVGLVLYWSLLGLGASLLVSNFPIPTLVFIIVAIVSGTAITLSEVLKRLVEGHRPLIEGGFGMFLFQAAVELFEKLISLFSNSMSFVRVGAFAIAHAGLSGAIFVFAGIIGGSNQSPVYWIVVVLGQLGLVAVEGLIVGIQTMRLHYYEFFSKFFTGGGMPYEPLAPLATSEN